MGCAGSAQRDVTQADLSIALSRPGLHYDSIGRPPVGETVGERVKFAQIESVTVAWVLPPDFFDDDDLVAEDGAEQ